MKVREERILADRKLVRSGGQLDELLAACWEETIDAGPYPVPEGRMDWGRVLQGDRFFALVAIRSETYGPEYAFSVPCTTTGCRSRIEWELNLTELPVRRLTEENRIVFEQGSNRFVTILPDSQAKVYFKLMTGADERLLPQAQRANPDRPFSAVLVHRVLEVEGVDPKNKRAFLEDLSLRDADFLVDEFDRLDCGVDTTIEIECPDCLRTIEVDLPFDQGFFLPGKGRTARRRGRTDSSPR